MAWVATRSGDADTADIAESLNLCDDSIKFELSSPRLGNEPRPTRPSDSQTRSLRAVPAFDEFGPGLISRSASDGSFDRSGAHGNVSEAACCFRLAKVRQ